MDKKIIKNNFNRYAHFYDKYSLIQQDIGAELIKKIRLNGFRDILELGCGTGNFTRLLRNKFKKARIKALDISQEMVDLCREKLREKGLEFIIADAEELELKENFDLVVSNAAFQWFMYPENSLNKYASCLRKGGRLLFSTFGPKTFWELGWVLRSLFKDTSIAASFFIAREELERMLANNFKIYNLTEKVYREEFNSLRELLLKIKYSGIRGNGLKKAGFLGKKDLGWLEELFLRKFKSIYVSYQVFYCRGLR